MRRWDGKGRVPFAIVAVLMLGLSVISTSYLTAVQQRYGEERAQSIGSGRMSTAMEAAMLQIESAAHANAMLAIESSTRSLGNVSALDSSFSHGFEGFLNRSFPMRAGDYTIEIGEHRAYVMQEDRLANDSVQKCAGKAEEVSVKDSAGTENTTVREVMDTSRPQERGSVEQPAYYMVAGFANVTVSSSDGRALRRTVEFDKSIKSPYPFLSAKVASQELACEGGMSSVPRIVKYILTEVAQFRTVLGYGSGMAGAPGTVADIISEKDVELALNLALVLDVASRFRSVDWEAVGFLDTPDGRLRTLAREYLDNGTVDPADLVALFYGYGGQGLPLDWILAQGISAVIDQFMLKYLDYFGIADIADDIYSYLQGLAEAIDDIGRSLSEFLGADDGEATDTLEQVGRWAETAMQMVSAASAYPPQQASLPSRLMRHAAGYTDAVCCDVYQPVNSTFMYGAELTALTSLINVPEVNATGTVIGTRYAYSLQNFTYWLTTLTSLAAGKPLGYLADFYPVSIVRGGTSSLWQTFYDYNYSDQLNAHYGSLREAVNNAARIISARIVSYLGGKPIYLAPLDPKDNSSLANDLWGVCDVAIDETFAYFRANPGALTSAILSLADGRAAMLMDLSRFVANHYDEIAGKASQIDSAASSIAGAALDRASYSKTSEAAWNGAYVKYNDIGHSLGYVDEQAPHYDTEGALNDTYGKVYAITMNKATANADFRPYAEQAYTYLAAQEGAFVAPNSPSNGYIVRALDALTVQSQASVLNVFVGIEDSLLGIGEKWVKGSIEAIIKAAEVSNAEYRPVVDAGEDGEFELRESESGNATCERLQAAINPSGLRAVASDAPLTGIEIPEPGTFLYHISEPQGTHYTDLTKFSERPFETAWEITIVGSARLSVRNGERNLIGPGGARHTWANTTLDLAFGTGIAVCSGWALQNVTYASTATLAGDIAVALDIVKGFFSWVLDSVMAPIKWLIDQVTMLIDMLTNLLNRLLSYAQQILQFISELVGYAVQLMQQFVKEGAKFVLDSIANWLVDLVPPGTTLSFSLFGFDFRVVLEPQDSGIPVEVGTPLILLDIAGSPLGARIDMDATILEMSQNMTNATGAEYDIIFGMLLDIGGMNMRMSVDPFMALQPRILMCEGGGLGWQFNVTAPEIFTSYDEFGYSLQDIPGVGEMLQNIVIPFLGLKASVDAGFTVQYVPPSFTPDHIVINEVEINPKGADVIEWAEIYNPTQGNVSLEGWNLTLGNESIVFDNETILGPTEYVLVELPGRPENDAGVFAWLNDSSNVTIDKTYKIHEKEGETIGNATVPPGGGMYTWQRSPNAADKDISQDWAFLPETPGDENPAKNLTLKALVLRLLEEAFRSAWDELYSTMGISIDFIVAYARLVAQKFIDSVLAIVEECVREVEFFLDIALTDITGSAGGGFRISFIIEGGQAARQILEWIIGSVAAFVAQLGNPSAPATYPQLAPSVPEHLYIRFEGYGAVGTPKLMKRACPEEECPEKMKLVGRIEANIPALMALAGKDAGKWRVNFGLYAEDMPPTITSKLFGSQGDEPQNVWVFRGSAWET